MQHAFMFSREVPFHGRNEHRVRIWRPWLQVCDVESKSLLASCQRAFRSALIGLASMIALLPLPGYLSQLVQKYQKEKMDKVRPRCTYHVHRLSVPARQILECS